jgi:CRISPR-associated endonuclease Cas1
LELITIIRLKIESQKMEHQIPKLNKAKTIKDILQVEGNASRDYYQQWEFDEEWGWDGRHGRTSINANAIDPINSILNFGYNILAQQMSETLLKRGFELSIGFMHHSETSKN